ncbi:phosphatidylinositol phosphatase PTPRQ-like isoform X2 [Centruroides vittatus]|uniref:phosphatidylinositol phosphatase PTPRQ-like isoform X2 n=1 Tax=Centruroides vittatus TaxID=120091 RepID=UPI00350F9A20
MANLFILAIFIICFQVSVSQIDVGNIDCTKNLHSFQNWCKNMGCRGRCTSSCIDVKEQIWGTETYTYDSPICRSALHDLRISSWNNSLRTVEFRYLNDVKVYVGSLKQNIETKDYGGLTRPSYGCYSFKSSRITEEILDIVSLHHNYFVNNGGTHTLECRISSNDSGRKIYFSKFRDSKEFEEPARRRGSYISYSHSWTETGGFWCKPERSMLSGVLSHAMRKYPQFLPTSFTITKSIKDKTEIKMNSNTLSKNWRKNKKEFSSHLNRFFGKDKANLLLKFNSLQIGDGGFYSLDNYYQYFENPGITRLIVRGYPVFKNTPTVKEVTSNSIELTFQEWEEDKDKGTGTPDYYIVQYKENGLENSEWKDSETIKANNSSNNIYIVSVINLQFDQTYSVRIIIKDISGHAQMNDAPILRTSTICGIPEEPPKDISIDTTSSTEIVVNWELPLQETWNCRNIYVNILYNSSNGESFGQNNTDNSFIITTEPFTEWNIALRLVNKDYFGEWSSLMNVISAQDAPSKVENLNARKVTDSRVYLNWDKPIKENGIIVKYIVRYRQVNWLHPCTSVNTSVLTKDVDAKETSIVINTYPNSKYSISVSAVTIKEGEETSINVITKESVPGGPPQNLKLFNIGNNRAGMQWDPPLCSLSYGNIIEYQYVLDSKDPWDKKKRSGKTVQVYEYVSDLVPFTVYTARVYAGTKIGFSSSSAEINFTTESDKPPAPTNFTIYLSTESILSMSWIPPYPPYGVLLKYVIEYCSLEGSSCRSRKTQKSVNSNEVKCLDDIRKSRHCYTLTDLTGNQKYKIEITAYNERIYAGSETVTTSGETKEFVPDPPKESEIANITEHSVDIIWSLPVRSNGELTGYRINITAAESFNNSIVGSTQEKLTNPDPRNCTFINLHPATKYNGTIEASTKIGYGKPLYFQFTTKVSVPVIDVEPTVTNVTDTTVVILIKPIHFIGGPVSAYFVMVEKQNKRKKRVVEEKKLLSYNESREDYVAAKFYPNEISSTGTDFTVGDGKHYNGYYNAPLTTGEKYKIGLAVLSEFNGEERLGYKYLTEAVTGLSFI